MKILYINDFLHYSGAEYVLNSLFRHFEKNNEVYIFFKYLKINGFPTFLAFTSKNFITKPTIEPKLEEAIQRIKPDLIHAHNISTLRYSPQILAKKCEKPLILTTHDYWLISKNRNNPFSSETNIIPHFPALNRVFSPIFEKRVHQGIQITNSVPRIKIVAVSNYVKNVLNRIFPIDMLCTITNGIDAEDKKIDFHTHTPFNRKYFLFTGGNSRLKGFNEVLKIAAFLRDENRATIVTTGVNSSSAINFSNNYLNQALGESKFKNRNLLLMPRLDREVFNDVMRNSYCLIFPSIWPEPCPIIVLEALAAGKPVVAYDVGGLSEMILHGKTGFLVPFGDFKLMAQYLRFLLDNPSAAKKMGLAGQMEVRTNWSSDKMFSQYERLYESMV